MWLSVYMVWIHLMKREKSTWLQWRAWVAQGWWENPLTEMSLLTVTDIFGQTRRNILLLARLKRLAAYLVEVCDPSLNAPTSHWVALKITFQSSREVPSLNKDKLIYNSVAFLQIYRFKIFHVTILKRFKNNMPWNCPVQLKMTICLFSVVSVHRKTA